MSAFRSPPSANNPERAPCFTPTDGAARRGPPRCAENCDPFLLISSHSTPEHALARGGRNLASPHLLNRQECTGWPASGLRSAYAGGPWPPLSSWRLLIPLLLGEGWGEGVRSAGVDCRSCGGRNLAARGPRLFQGAPKCAKVGHATPAGAPNRGRPPDAVRRRRCAVTDQPTRPCRDRDRGACPEGGGGRGGYLVGLCEQMGGEKRRIHMYSNGNTCNDTG